MKRHGRLVNAVARDRDVNLISQTFKWISHTRKRKTVLAAAKRSDNQNLIYEEEGGVDDVEYSIARKVRKLLTKRKFEDGSVLMPLSVAHKVLLHHCSSLKVDNASETTMAAKEYLDFAGIKE